jgi:2-phosphoglycerate kinase
MEQLNKRLNKIMVIGKNYEMPFSKGILARSLTAIGMKPTQSYKLASEIESILKKEGITSILKDDLRTRVYYYLITKNYETIAEKYLVWRDILKKHPIIILIGGASGVGTSTIAFELASRLGIPSVMGTDSIREVIRRSISRDLVPVLYNSSYDAWKSLRLPVENFGCDKHIIGFERHIEPVLIGIEGIIDRSLTEGSSIIIEGTHIVPGIMSEKYSSMPNIITIVLTLSSEEMHKQRFSARAKVSARPMERYMDNFKIIRKINDYIVENAKYQNTPVIENVSISDSVNKVLEIISDRFESIENIDNE